MFTFKIAHPNDALLGHWKVIETYAHDSLTQDFLQSPSFEIYDGLIARVTRGVANRRAIFTGASLDGHWVDLGPDSEFMNKHRFQYGISRFGLRLSFLDAWKTCGDPQMMLGSLRRILSAKKTIELVTVICRKAAQYATEQRIPAKTIELLGRWANEDLSTKSLIEFVTKFSTGHPLCNATMGCALATQDEDPIEHLQWGITMCIETIALTRDRGYARRTICDEMRRCISFHDIIIGGLQ